LATPIEWLWQELERRYGPDVADEIHLAFNEQKRIYEKERKEKMNLRHTFYDAAVNDSITAPIEQRFVVAGRVINLITFVSRGDIPHIGIVLEQGEAQTGYFQQRGYVGNSLKGGKINPINVASGIYDLTLDNEIVASFHCHPKRGITILEK
jgi:hypothetical protein